MYRFFTYKEFLFEKEKPAVAGHSLIMEGGAAGHMAHPFEDKSLTFGDFKKLVEVGLQGELNFEEEATEKTDGQNLFATIQDGEVKFARGVKDMRYPMDLKAIKQKFDGHTSKGVEDTFKFAAEDLARQLIKLSPKDQEVFNNGKNFMNMELIYSKNPNVIRYDHDVIQFHGIKETDGEGNLTGDVRGSGKAIVDALSKVEANIGKTFTIIPPQIIKLGKDINFEENKDKFFKKIEVLRKQYNLEDHDEVSKYHEAWWREQIEKYFKDLTQDVKEGLLLRWAYGDKQTLDMRAIGKLVNKEQITAIKKFDKEDVKKKYKENIRPFEDLFLELGSIILKNASNFIAVNPSKEMQRLHKYFKEEAAKIKKGGDIDQIKKIETELARLERIGGIESVVPSEGLVFIYKGKTYKLTGTFAPFNQLLGIIKYGR